MKKAWSTFKRHASALFGDDPPSNLGISVRDTGTRLERVTLDFQRQPEVEGYLMRVLEETVEALLLRGSQPGEIFETVANALQAQADKQGIYISQLRPSAVHADIKRSLLVGELGDMLTFFRAAAYKAGVAQWELDDAVDAKLRALEAARASGALSENYKYGTPYKRRKTQ